MKIANKISFSFLGIVIVLTITAVPTFYFIARSNLQEAIYEQLESVVRAKTQHIETYLEMLKISIGQFSKSVVLENFLKTLEKNPEGSKEAFDIAMTRLRRTKEVNSEIYEFLLLNRNGVVVASTNEKSIGSEKYTDAFFVGGQKSVYIKDAYYLESINERLVTVSAPLLDAKTGEFLGVLAARVRLAGIDKIMEEKLGPLKSLETYIVNKYGYMFTPSEYLANTFLKQKIDSVNFRNCLLDRDKKNEHILLNYVSIFTNYAGVKVLGAHAYIPEMQWCVLGEVDESEALAPLVKIYVLFLIILFAVPLAAWIFGIVLSRLIAAPIHRLHKGTEIIGEGNLDYKVGTDARDEIGQLSRAFDQMTDSLKKTTISVNKLNIEIEQRKQVEDKLKKSESKIRAVLDQTFQFIGIMTVDGTLIEVNKAAIDLIGSDASSYLNKPFWDTPWWTHSPQLQEKLRQAVKKAAAGEFMRFEATHKAKDGSLHYIDFSLKPIKDSSGNVIYMIPEGRDITERKAMEEKLSATAKEWEATFNSISDLVSIQDRDSRLVKVNKAYADLFKMAPEELIGRKCYSVVHEANAPCLDCPHQNTIKTQKVSRLEYFDKRFNVYFEVSTSPIIGSNNETIGTVHIVKDITERKKVEEALKEAIGLKSYFTSMVSHELRTPLTAIKEGISIVMDGSAGQLNDEQKNFLDISKRNVDRLARLINDVLDYQKLESGRYEFHIQENDINKIINEVQDTMISMAKNKGIDIVLNLDKNLPKIKCDKDKIIQVFTNLISNAIKFTEKGNIAISSVKGDNIVKIIIKDTGIGIKTEDLSKLFTAFEQLEKGNARKTGGTGLGLVISKEIIEKHKGKIWVESEFGKGSEFHIVLPIVEKRV
ncbi:MAG: PAS domain S-box protein [Candidatus Omnitrophota bacterium]|jgi:PAS domain S-box-containing protein